MKKFEEYMKEYQEKLEKEKQEVDQNAVYDGMLGFAEMMADPKFADWIEKQKESILEKFTVKQLFEKFMKEVKK